ncbi:transposable element Tcb2 transposase [Trichonephila clavipes]|nr:transposable element Tcb2 transposase [Trichonephila clavipes]
MQILCGKYVNVHVCVGGASIKTGFISTFKLRRISLGRTPQRIYWCCFEAISSAHSIQIVTVKMSTQQRLGNRMRWQIVRRLEAGQCQVQISRENNLTAIVVCNLLKQFQDTGSIESKHLQGHTRATTTREDRHLSIIVRRHRGSTASQLSRYLKEAA